jgi:hypothetical protein
LASLPNPDTGPIADRIRRSSMTNNEESSKEHSPKKSNYTAIGLSRNGGVELVEIRARLNADLLWRGFLVQSSSGPR